MTYLKLKSIDYSYKIIVYIMMIFFVIIIFVLCHVKAYSSYTTYGLYQNNALNIDIDVNNSDIIKKASFIKIDNEKYYYEISSISMLYSNNNVNYNTYIINVNKSYIDNEVVEITFYYKNEVLIKKIINCIF